MAVADEDAAGRASAVKRLGVDRDYAEDRTMRDREKLEFVAIAPRWLDCHKEMAVNCAERGIHVFCEKPLAPTLADCDAIVAACKRTHTKMAVAFQTRYSSRHERTRELIAEGAIGEILEIRGHGKEDQRGGGEDLIVLGVHILRRGLGDRRGKSRDTDRSANNSRAIPQEMTPRHFRGRGSLLRAQDPNNSGFTCPVLNGTIRSNPSRTSRRGSTPSA